MARTASTDLFNPQILLDAIRGVLRGKTAFMGSALVSGGAVAVNGTMPQGGRGAIGRTIDVPYFGTVPGFVDTAEGSPATPQKIAMTSEQATVARKTLSIETTTWARGLAAISAALIDPHDEAARQVAIQVVRCIDSVIVSKFAATPLKSTIFSATSPQYLSHRAVVRARSIFGDDQNDIVGMVVHSQAEADLAEQLDANGRPLLTETVKDTFQGQVVEKRFAGVPLVVSDLAPLTGSTMGAVTSSGTTPPVVTLAAQAPLGAWNLVIDIVVGGASGTATFKFSVDGGNTYSATLVVPSAGGSIDLTDTAVDSLVGMNGATGITATFANGTYNADNLYTATALLEVTSLLCQRGAGAFWYNEQALGPQPFHDTLVDSDLLTLHMYFAALLYRRRAGGVRPGVVALQHNVRNYIGV